MVDIFSDMLDQIKTKNLTINVKVSQLKYIGLLSNIQFDKDCLYNIFYNFILNSIDMAEVNGKVSLHIDLE